MDYVEQAGIRIAKPLYEFVNTESLPGTSIERRRVLERVRRTAGRPGTALQGAARQARQHAAADRRLAPGQQGQADRHRRLSAFPARDRLSGAGAGVASPSAPRKVDPEIATSPGRSLSCR